MSISTRASMGAHAGALGASELRDRIRCELAAIRNRLLALVEPLPAQALTCSPSPLMSPLIWDMGHIAHYEERWLVRALGGIPRGDPLFDDIFDPQRHSRAVRPLLPMPDFEATLRYLEEVRSRALENLDSAEFDPDNPLLTEGFVYGMVAQHESMHIETMLATIQLMENLTYPVSETPPPPIADAQEECFLDGGMFLLGADKDAWALDNERPAQWIHLKPYVIDSVPISTAKFLEFIEDGGYGRDEFWSADGVAWRNAAGATAPEFWTRCGGDWFVRRFGKIIPLPRTEPVQHVTWHEAGAYARWAGKRLPTEAEWERAAGWDGVKKLYPWGDHLSVETLPSLAGLDGARFGPAQVGSFPEGASARGVRQLIGDVWEWTSSDFKGYSGFVAFPYREYSEIFFGSGHKVLKGGSWATSRIAIRNSFRNWDLPVRRQIFSGFRCARSV